MTAEELKERNLENEMVFTASRSGGPGGQNVNKVSTKVELRFNLLLSGNFSGTEKEIILRKLKNKINNEGELIFVAQSERTRLLNKNVVTEKFYSTVSKALTLPEKRIRTRPTITSKIKRLDGKRIRGTIKKMRKKSEGPDGNI
jgi:ribosome-associated protein